MNRITTDTLLRNELFRKSEFSGNSVVIPYTSEGAAAKMKRLEVVETRQDKREGYNLVDIKNCTLGAVTKEDLDDTSFIVTTITTSNYRLINFPLGILKADTYTISIENLEILEGVATESTGIVQLYKDGTFVRSIRLNENKKQTFQITEENNYLIKYLLIGATAAEQNIKAKITGLMIYQGTEEKPYEPYGAVPSLDYPSEVQGVDSISIGKSNKNIAEINQKDWELTENNTIKNKSVTENKDLLIKKIKLKKGQVLKTRLVLFSKPLNSTTFTAYLNNRATVCQVLNYTNINNNEFELNKAYDRTYTAIEDCEIFYVCWGNANNDIFEFQFSASIDDNDLKYVVHKSKEYKLPIQQKMLKGDYFDIASKKEVHVWKKIELTGNENWTIARELQNSNIICYQYENYSIALKLNKVEDYFISNSFESSSGNICYSLTKENAIGADDYRHLRVCVNKKEYATIDEFKAKLAELYNEGKAVEIYYKLATPLELDCTEIKELENMTTYADKTIIILDNDLTELTVEVEQSRMSILEEKLKKEETI